MEENKLFNIGTLYEGTVIKRPSIHCKTPYVADVLLDFQTENSGDGDGDGDGGNENIMAHTAALGCCGMADTGAKVLMTKVKNKKNVCSYKIMLSLHEERGNTQYIGIDPKLAETIVDYCLKKKLLTTLKDTCEFVREFSYLNSRFDFAGYDKNENDFILEVKNVPLADYDDCCKKDRKKRDFTGRDYNDKVAYFPDGYRKKTTEPVSPRALKHIKELQRIRETTNIRAILCFVIQRTDVSSFQPSIIDPIYRDAVISAVNAGVEIIALVCKWMPDGNVYFVRDDLKINLDPDQ